MSRLGKIPIDIPQGVEVIINPEMAITIKGPNGQLSVVTEKRVTIRKEENQVHVARHGDSKADRAFHGLYQRLIRNMVIGVTDGFKKELQIEGVGYRAAKQGAGITLSLGYSHPINFPAPEGITIEVPENTRIVVTGADKQQVGQVAADIRALRKPEPYKGKGVRYVGEHIRRKVGKTGA
ncbi:50S ribosomal protein L6 [bacterium]|nr:50S ribosomal protein L6 [bacterium]